MFLFINKPVGITSHDVVDQIRRVTGQRRVGHAGTLDPFATGLLIVGVERESTKKLGEFLKLDKQYEAVLYLGATSNTFDSTGVITPTEQEHTRKPPTRSLIESTLSQFTGDILQTPPMYSAKKVNGKKLYELARKGIEIERVPHSIHIYSLEMVHYDFPHLTIRVHCGSGTYIRSLAHDIGHAVGVGAYCDVLVRTAIGPYLLADAISLKQLTPDNWKQFTKEV